MLEEGSIFLYLTVGSCFYALVVKLIQNKYDIIKLAINDIGMVLSGMLFVIHTQNFLFVHIQKIKLFKAISSTKNSGLYDFSST